MIRPEESETSETNSSLPACLLPEYACTPAVSKHVGIGNWLHVPEGVMVFVLFRKARFLKISIIYHPETQNASCHFQKTEKKCIVYNQRFLAIRFLYGLSAAGRKLERGEIRDAGKMRECP